MGNTSHHRSSTRTRNHGVALLMVLLIVLAVTIISAGFIARADVELSCGTNMLIRAQTDQLANSGLEHAKGLLLRPQDNAVTPRHATDWYWLGSTRMRLLATSSDYYDVTVSRDASDYRTYRVVSTAYRETGGVEVGRTSLSADVRLDPCIALWTRTDTTFRQNWVVQGDVCAEGNLVSQAPTASLDGDVFATQLTGTSVGQRYDVADLSLVWPTAVSTFDPYHSVSTVSGTLSGTYSSTPRRIYKCTGNLVLAANTTIYGMLLVTDNLTVAGSGCKIICDRNLPALYVGGDLVLSSVDNLTVEGLAVVNGGFQIDSGASGVKFTGGLCVGGTIAETTRDVSGYDNYTLIRGNPVWTSGRLGGALELDGVDDYVQTSDSTTKLQLAGDYTLALWLKAASVQKNDAGIMVKCSPDGSTTHWALRFNSTAPTTLIMRHAADGGNAWSTGITLGEIGNMWRHVAVVRSGTTMTSYLDSEQRNSAAWAYASGTGNGHLKIGVGPTGSQDHAYGGAVDDVQIYGYALTKTKIGSVYGGSSAANIIGYWQLDGPGSGVTIQADPIKAAIVTWINGVPKQWSPAAGAFFRNIERQ